MFLFFLDENKNELVLYVKNYFLILFNLYIVEENEGYFDKLLILEIVRVYLSIIDYKVSIVFL